jgi:hypothetical protein
LRTKGVDRVFGVPGEENLDVVESLRQSRIELVLLVNPCAQRPAREANANRDRLASLNFASGKSLPRL